MRYILNSILKLIGSDRVIQALVTDIIFQQVSKLPSAIQSALTIRDSDLKKNLAKLGINKEENFRKVRDAFRNFAAAGGAVVQALNEAKQDEM